MQSATGLVFAGVLAAATCNAKAQEADIAAGHAFAREACKACHVVESSRLPKEMADVTAYILSLGHHR